jgi:hypothetical protein
MITYLINQVALAGFNLINSRVDAYRILRHKTIAHAVNLCAYAVFALVLYYFTTKPVLSWSDFPYWDFLIYLFSAFTNRQGTFDIPLNLRRGLKWDHVSQAKPPAAWLDRQEIRLFGYNGRAPLVMYGAIWLACLIIKFFL